MEFRDDGDGLYWGPPPEEGKSGRVEADGDGGPMGQ